MPTKQQKSLLYLCYILKDKNISVIYSEELDCLATNKKLNEIYENNGFKFIKEGYDYYHYVLREWKVEK